MIKRHQFGFACVWAACAASVLAGPAQSLVLTTHSVYGREYVALGDVMRVFALKAQSGRDRSVTLFSPQARARFVVDSREAEVQGVKYWLTAPLAVKSGQMWLPAVDVVKTLDPLLRGSGLMANGPLRTIVLDPGHGGDDQGSRARNGLLEKHLTLDMARRLHALLAAKGYCVLLTRTDDRDMALQSRSAFARGNHADLFVSIHFNSVTSSSEPCGAETYCLTPAGAPSTANRTTSPIASDFVSFLANRFDNDNVVLAHYIQQHLVSKTGAAERGVKRARFEVLKDLTCPGVLVECGFLSNAGDLRLISQDTHRQKLAAAIASGIEAYK
ncbi:MAG: N-acetylmuramoyl-L-alanine amidase, partial [Verrucomicrobiae bacterium]|nr:N-acetylmuramoyl-L-alanine amidase [Verrucomicrobiae bacterium]